MTSTTPLRILQDHRPLTYRILLAALAIDVAILGIYVFYGAADILLDWGKMPKFWNIAEEGSAGELFNYLKWIGICGGLAIVYFRSRIPMFAGFAFTFMLVLLDDSLQLHERGGHWLVETFGIQPAFGLRAQDFGELSVWAFLGGVTGLVLLYGLVHRTKASMPYGLYFFFVLVALVFFAMGLDMVNALDFLNEETALVNIMVGIITIAEDGGEMFVASFGLAGMVAALKASEKVGDWLLADSD